MARRLIVIGGDAGGMTAASTAKRRAGDELEVVVFERDGWTSYSACGIPYWVAGDVDEAEDLVVRSPEEHRANGIDVRTHTEVTAIDPTAATVTAGGTEHGYDELVIATGATPVRPDVPGIDQPNVLGVQTLGDGQRLVDALADHVRTAVVIGAGYIGLEMAEACMRRDMEVTVVERSQEPMGTLDPDMGRLIGKAMEDMGITVVTGAEVTGVDESVHSDAGDFPADVVILGTGVRPAAGLAESAGLPLGDAGGIRTEDTMRVQGHEHVWAVGDCVESVHRVTGQQVHIPLGTHANKQGLVAGLDITGRQTRFPGVVGTAVTKVCDLEVARTGLAAAEAHAAGLDVVSATIEATTKAGYFPGASPLTVKMLAERSSGRIVGAQIVGREGSAKRIDAVALAIWNEMTTDDLLMSDMGYAPPLSPLWDPVQVAARATSKALG